MVTRALTLLLALLACAWFALGIRQAHDTAQADAIVSGTAALSNVQADHAASLLTAARFLNPDAEVDVLRGQLALRQGDRAAARRILGDVVQREPMNVVAWLWLAKSSSGDERLGVLALHQIARLDPTVPPVP